MEWLSPWEYLVYGNTVGFTVAGVLWFATYTVSTRQFDYWSGPKD